jgi:hypothetical protein
MFLRTLAAMVLLGQSLMTGPTMAAAGDGPSGAGACCCCGPAAMCECGCDRPATGGPSKLAVCPCDDQPPGLPLESGSAAGWPREAKPAAGCPCQGAVTLAADPAHAIGRTHDPPAGAFLPSTPVLLI